MSNAIQFWLSYNNGAERLQLPVNPESISISSSYGYEDVQVSQLGEFTVIGDANLRDFSFSSFFPRAYSPSYCEYEAIPDPWTAVETLERWRDSRKPCRLTITGTPINYAVTIRSLDIEPEKAGSPGDIYFSLALKEYKFVSIRKVDMSATGNAKVTSPSVRPPSTKETPGTYVVKKGDTLSGIAAKNKLNTRDLHDKNTKVIGKDPNKIYPGQKLVLA
ncbi:LysM peptidoglycan-binding domain-containing protein [Brevibacillus daliensis]|uniref:LysM peptidoglycan-binding domain-containing protein n=1 Tax=Brevibacillus daliensis TaxID=2892995 RepID=UPI001E3562FE|nr:LysM peptidoglycan-binding domain-containing protein [Brevibacillus daliensis]